MRASDLLGRTVTVDGRKRFVVGLRGVQDGPMRGALRSIRLDGVIVSNRRVGADLGFHDRSQQGPWLLGAIVRLAHRGTQVVPWADVRDQLVGSEDEVERDRSNGRTPPR